MAPWILELQPGPSSSPSFHTRLQPNPFFHQAQTGHGHLSHLTLASVQLRPSDWGCIPSGSQKEGMLVDHANPDQAEGTPVGMMRGPEGARSAGTGSMGPVN
ncbi:hypothetical protein SRHO_G00029620 [Serrasalmus rhombeus]